MTVKPCPECAAGKCGNCNGETWDDTRDDVTACPCHTAGHDLPTCPHRCSCTSDDECDHDCDCEETR